MAVLGNQTCRGTQTRASANRWGRFAWSSLFMRSLFAVRLRPRDEAHCSEARPFAHARARILPTAGALPVRSWHTPDALLCYCDPRPVAQIAPGSRKFWLSPPTHTGTSATRHL